MTPKTVVCVFCVFWSFVGLVLTDGCEKLPTSPRVRETDPPGTEIFHLNVTDNVTYTLTSVEPTYMLDYLTWHRDANDSQYVMAVNVTLDLEGLRDKHGSVSGLVTIHMECMDNHSKRATTLEGVILIAEVNEFTPEFMKAPYFLNVSEDEPVDSSLIKLRDHAYDRDVNLSIPEISNFGMVPYDDAAFDGRGMFYMPRTQNGVIQIRKPLDFESMAPGLNYYYLNVTVVDSGSRMNHTWIKLTVLDADDQDPEFYTPDCTLKCYTSYDTDVTDGFTGPLKDINPYRILARDRDTLNYSIEFFLKGGNPSTAEDYFTIDRVTGVVTVIRPLKSVDESVAAITLFIEAQEMSALKRSTTTTLRVGIIGRTTTSSPDTTKSPLAAAADSPTLLVVLTVVAAVFFLVICAMIVSLVYVRKKYKRPIAPEDTPSVSEASTDLDELSIDQWPVPYNNSKMETFGTHFDKSILKDTATKTDAQTSKKRRARVRNKSRDPGVFDGTREYEGVADPEFFTQRDKTKIKLSSRSRDHNTDPKYWITVDNDY